MSAARRRQVVYGITAGVSADKLLRGQLAWMRSRGWDLTLAVDPGEQAEAVGVREGVRVLGIPMRRELSPSADLRSLRDWMGRLRALRPGVVNASTPKAGLLGMVSAALTRVPRRVYVMRGLRLEGAGGVLRLVLWGAEKATILAATDVIVVSASLGRAAREAGLLGRRRTWLVGEGSSNGVLAADVRGQAEAGRRDGLRERLGFADGDLVVGYVGRITPDKGVDMLTEALRGLEEEGVRGLFVGSADGDAQIDLGPAAVHVDWTDEVWRHYGAMDVLCLPTRREGFPNVVLEAAAAGVPTVTTRATGAVDSVVEGVTGLLVDVGDADGLREALRSLARDRAAVPALGEAARERAETVFAPEHVWAGVESVMAGTPAAHVRRV